MKRCGSCGNANHRAFLLQVEIWLYMSHFSGNSQLKGIILQNKKFTGNTNSLMIVTHRVNFRHFFMLAHIIEYNRQKRYYVLRVPYSLEIRCLFDCRKLFRVLSLWNNGFYTLFLTDLHIFYYNFRAVQVFIPSPWKLDVYSKPAFSIEKIRYSRFYLNSHTAKYIERSLSEVIFD